MFLSDSDIKATKEIMPSWLLPLSKRKAGVNSLAKNAGKALEARLTHNLTPYQSGFHCYTWGDGITFNALPQVLEDAILNNGIALRAIETLCTYAIGEGFTHEDYNDLSTTIFGKGKAGYKNIRNFLAETATNAIWYDGAFAVRVLRNQASGQVMGFENLPLGNTRIGRYEVNNHRAFRYSDIMNRQNYVYNFDEILPEFEPSLSNEEGLQVIEAAKVANGGKYYGEVYYHYMVKPGAPIYPIPPLFASLDLVKGSSASEKAFNKKAVQAWMPNIIVTIPMVSDEVGQNGQPSEAQKLQRYLGQASRSEVDNTMMLMQLGAGQEANITSLQSTTPPKDMVEVIEAAGREVCKVVGIAPELAGFSTAGQLGNNQQIEQAQTMAINKGARIIAPILDFLYMIYTEMGQELSDPLVIKPLKLFNAIDPTLAPYLYATMTNKQALECSNLQLDPSIPEGPMYNKPLLSSSIQLGGQPINPAN